MQISGLSASNTFSATDVLAIEVNVNGVNKTYKMTGATLATALASIGSYLKTTDVVNNLTNTATDKPGSANMLKTLNDKLANLLPWKSASSYTEAYNNATSDIALEGKGTISSGNINVCLTLIIPKISIPSNESYYFMVSDRYNNGTEYHIQAVLHGNYARDVGLFEGADKINNEQLQWLYR